MREQIRIYNRVRPLPDSPMELNKQPCLSPSLFGREAKNRPKHPKIAAKRLRCVKITTAKPRRKRLTKVNRTSSSRI